MTDARRMIFLALAWVVASTCFGEDMTVRAINGKTGKPIVDKLVKLYAKDPKLYPQYDVKLLARATTSPDGSALFHLSSPLPKEVFVTVGEPSDIFSCSTRLGFSTGEVLRSGVVSDNRCERKRKLTGQFSAKPGEIIIFARRKTGRDLFWQEL